MTETTGNNWKRTETTGNIRLVPHAAARLPGEQTFRQTVGIVRIAAMSNWSRTFSLTIAPPSASREL